jgi:peptidoglycan/xylan/chitin deacetylase (PgdA/CDA1 family)
VFAEQLDSLLATHRFVTLDEALAAAPVGARRVYRPRVAITFDDAYAGALTVGVAELKARQLPATIFVTPGFIGGGMFWWDILADPDSDLDSAFRERALSSARGLTKDVLHMAREAELPQHVAPAHARGATPEQLTAALEFEGITLGAHTWNHPNLTSLVDADLRNELVQPLEWLKRFGDRGLPMISYPYGLADRRVMDAARDAGYRAGFMIEGGWAKEPLPDPFAVPRLNVPAGISRYGFDLRAAGQLHG